MSVTIKIPNLPAQAERLYDIELDPNIDAYVALPDLKTWIISLNWQKLYAAIQAHGIDTFTSFFQMYTNLRSVNVKGWDVSQVTDIAYMFADCVSLTELDLSGWDTSACEEMESFVSGCDSMQKIWAPSTFVATNAVTKPFEMGPYIGGCQIYTDAADANSVGWGTIDSTFTVHWGATYQDFLNA